MAEMETALAKRKAINRQVDALIRAAAASVKKLEGSAMRSSQLRNLLGVAATTQSIEEVTNFIRYQIGREGRQKSWSHNDFGQSVIADIEAKAVKSATDAVQEQVPEADLVEVRAELIALYVGYMNRCFVYAEKTNDWQGLSRKLEEAANV